MILLLANFKFLVTLLPTLKNILDIDSAGRIFSTKFSGATPKNQELVRNIPVSGAFDFSAAFPSVIHWWIWLVLKHKKLQQSFINLFQAIYKNAFAIYKEGKNIHKIIHFLSGVLQGCPGSSVLFNNALDPFLYDFFRALNGDGNV